MKIYLLSNEKLKIHISRSDLEQMHMLYADINYEKEQTKEFLTAALNRANTETGFRTDNSRLLIETFPAFDKGVNIYITKLAVINYKWYIFESLEDLLAFANIASDSLHCSLYNYDSQYILSIRIFDDIDPALDIHLISEYANTIHNEIKLWHMIEFSTEILKDKPIRILKQICI